MFYWTLHHISSNLIWIIILVTLSATVSAQEKIIYQSTLAWKVTTENRIIYVVGERHNFYSVPDNINISHKLGIDIYNNSDAVYMEQKQVSFRENNPLISKSVSNKLWQDIEHVVKKTISLSKSLSENEKYNFSKNILNEIDDSSPVSAYGNLIALNILSYDKKNKLKNINGLSYKIIKIDTESKNKKIIPIENNNSLSTAWFNYCSNSNESEILLTAALQHLQKPILFFATTLENSQYTFLLATKKNINYRENLLITDEQADPIILKCAIIPRNYDWIKKIQDDLKKQGKPLMILAGINHIIGDNGIISLLKNLGYSDIIQIHEFK